MPGMQRPRTTGTYGDAITLMANSEGRTRRQGRGRIVGALLRRGSLLAALCTAGCDLDPPAPRPLFFAGLPVSGDWHVALRAGFKDCIDMDAIHVRCRRHGVMLYGQGPYEAAVDLSGSDGESGFSLVTLWQPDDNDAVYNVIIALARRGWHYCYTGDDRASDQAVFTRSGEPVRISMDISYWGRRRLRVIPQWNPTGSGVPCTPDDDLVRFGTDVAKAAQAGR